MSIHFPAHAPAWAEHHAPCPTKKAGGEDPPATNESSQPEDAKPRGASR